MKASGVLSELRIEGFRSFGIRQRIRLKPLTVICGPNSSGKSAILQSLLLLRQSLTQRQFSGQTGLTWVGRDVSLGSLSRVLRGDVREIGLGLSVTGESGATGSVDLRVAEAVGGGDEVIELLMGLDGEVLERWTPDDERSTSEDVRRGRRYRLAWTNESHPLWRSLLDGQTAVSPLGRHYLESALRDNLPLRVTTFEAVLGVGGDDERRELRTIGRRLLDAVDAGSPEALARVSHELRRRWGSVVVRRWLPTYGVVCLSWPHDGRSEDDSFLDDECAYVPTLHNYNDAGRTIDGVLSRIRHLPGVRGQVLPVPRAIFGGEPDADDWFEAAVSEPGTLEEINSWFYARGLPVRAEYADQQGLRFRDRRTSKVLPAADISYGIGQLLPVVVAMLSGTNALILAEQPELHLHPGLQADVADLALRAVHRGHRCVIETHSEYLVLRLLRRLRESARGQCDDDFKASPEDVGLLYVDKQGDTSRVVEIGVSRDGRLLDPWPDSFFFNPADVGGERVP